MLKVVSAKISLLTIHKNAVARGNVVRQILSVSSIVPIIIMITFIVAVAVGIHKYDPTLFIDIGLQQAAIQEKK
jgi:hypothetical protein